MPSTAVLSTNVHRKRLIISSSRLRRRHCLVCATAWWSGLNVPNIRWQTWRSSNSATICWRSWRRSSVPPSFQATWTRWSRTFSASLAFATPPGKSAPRINWASSGNRGSEANDREPFLGKTVGFANKFAVKKHVFGRQETHFQERYAARRRDADGRACYRRALRGPAQGEQP